jgi:hypothetical protein
MSDKELMLPADLAEVVIKIAAIQSDQPEVPAAPRVASRRVLWEEQVANLPTRVMEWSTKDFVNWFAAAMEERVGLPYSINYSRDIARLNEISAEMKRMGMSSKQDLKSFLDWSFERSSAISQKEGVFSLSSIMRYLNEYLQEMTLPAGASREKPRLGYDLLEAMAKEGKSGATLGILKRFGVPLTATYFERVKGLEREKILAGISSRLDQLAAEGKHEEMRDIFQQSVGNSPYPEWMFLTDWRAAFETQVRVSKSRSQRWWRQTDFEGLPFEEYDALRGDLDASPEVQ